jgi:excisionase family DNA binding protein
LKKKPSKTGELDYFTPEQAAAILQINRETLYRVLKAGKFNAIRIGKSWRIPRSEVLPKPVLRET